MKRNKDEVINELKTELSQKSEDFTQLEHQVEELGKFLNFTLKIFTLLRTALILTDYPKNLEILV